VNTSVKHTTIFGLFILLLVLALGYSVYAYHNLQLEKNNGEAMLVTAQNELQKAQQEKQDLINTLQEAANKNKDFADQLSQVTDTANKLRWLNYLDPQLLQKYSKVYFLNENYTPRELSPIDSKYLFTASKNLQIHDRVLPFLQHMLQDAALENIAIQVDSAYRSFATQATLKAGYKVRYGIGANSFSAEQGYSEHQLGTALDFTTPSLNGALSGFDTTPAYAWLQNNAYKYGFILSYPKNNAYYVYEPWHWRFVGIELATKLHADHKNFYDLDQREITTYLATMFNVVQN
jgi:D-alanyl-D-alanine carboxypeptidase